MPQLESPDHSAGKGGPVQSLGVVLSGGDRIWSFGRLRQVGLCGVKYLRGGRCRESKGVGEIEIFLEVFRRVPSNLWLSTDLCLRGRNY